MSCWDLVYFNVIFINLLLILLFFFVCVSAIVDL